MTLRIASIVIKSLLLITAIYFTFRGLVLSLSLLAPFIIAVLVAISNERPVRFIERRLKIPRSTASLFMVIVAVSIFGLLLVLLLGKIAAELADLAMKMPYFQAVLTETGEGWVASLQAYLHLVPLDVLSTLNNTASMLLERATTLIPAILAAVLGLVALVPNMLVFMIMAIVATFFFSRDLSTWRNRAIGLVPSGAVKPGLQIFTRLMSALWGWAKTQLIIMSCTAVAVMIGLSILNVRYIVLLGIIVGIVDALPVLGPGAVFLPWIAYTLLVGNPMFALGLLIIYGVTVVVRHIIEPLVLPDNVGLEPIPTLVSMYVGMRVFGFMGLAFGPILLVSYTALEEAGVVGKVKEWLLS